MRFPAWRDAALLLGATLACNPLPSVPCSTCGPQVIVYGRVTNQGGPGVPQADVLICLASPACASGGGGIGATTDAVGYYAARVNSSPAGSNLTITLTVFPPPGSGLLGQTVTRAGTAPLPGDSIHVDVALQPGP
jgi:hypothetical protein